jgi:hypothetical protein
MLSSAASETGKSGFERLEVVEDLISKVHTSNNEIDNMKMNYDSFGNTINLETSNDFNGSSSLYDGCESDDEFSGA